MPPAISLDGRTLVGVTNTDTGEVSNETRFHFEHTGERISAHYAGGDVLEGYLVGTCDGTEWEIRYTQINTDLETATGHSIGTLELLEDGRVRVTDEWEWESNEGGGQSVLEEVTQE